MARFLIWLVSLATASSMVALLVYHLVKPSLEAVSPQMPTALSAPATQSFRGHAPPEVQELPKPIQRLAPHERNAQGQQILFNDQNYRPKPLVNHYAAPEIRRTALNNSDAPPRPRARQQSLQQDGWQWSSANKERISGRFEWLEVDGSIDYGSVCQNYRAGSLIYRDCRKGAKASFARQCHQGRRIACHAENNYMP